MAVPRSGTRAAALLLLAILLVAAPSVCNAYGGGKKGKAVPVAPVAPPSLGAKLIAAVQPQLATLRAAAGKAVAAVPAADIASFDALVSGLVARVSAPFAGTPPALLLGTLLLCAAVVAHVARWPVRATVLQAAIGAATAQIASASLLRVLLYKGGLTLWVVLSAAWRHPWLLLFVSAAVHLHDATQRGRKAAGGKRGAGALLNGTPGKLQFKPAAALAAAPLQSPARVPSPAPFTTRLTPAAARGSTPTRA